MLDTLTGRLGATTPEQQRRVAFAAFDILYAALRGPSAEAIRRRRGLKHSSLTPLTASSPDSDHDRRDHSDAVLASQIRRPSARAVKHLTTIDFRSTKPSRLGKEHLRGRVALQERHPTLPSWLVRAPYRLLIPPTAHFAERSLRRSQAGRAP